MDVWSSGWVDDEPTVICAGQQVGDADVVLGLFQPKWWGVGRLGGPDWHWAVRDG